MFLSEVSARTASSWGRASPQVATHDGGVFQRGAPLGFTQILQRSERSEPVKEKREARRE
jgi:hypothetical protein